MWNIVCRILSRILQQCWLSLHLHMSILPFPHFKHHIFLACFCVSSFIAVTSLWSCILAHESWRICNPSVGCPWHLSFSTKWDSTIFLNHECLCQLTCREQERSCLSVWKQPNHQATFISLILLFNASLEYATIHLRIHS